jgi:folate-binding protein YgfZ
MRGYEAIEKTSGVIDRSGEGRVRVAGADRAAWLQGLLTNDIAALAPGSGCYAAYLTPHGRMISDVRVLNHGDFLLLDLPAAQKDAVLQRFDLFIITEDVTLEDVTASLARIGLHGRGLWQTLSACVELPAGAPISYSSPLAEHASIAATFRGTDVIVAGSWDTGLPGVDLYIAADAAAALRAALLAAGAELVDDEAWEARRVEAGRPRFGVDMNEDTIPLEAGIEDRAISFTKGCYVGQEIIIRVMHRGGGRVARKLVGLAQAGDGATQGRGHGALASVPASATGLAAAPDPSRAGPAAGAPIFSGDRQIGQLTSVAQSPALGHWIALGYVHRDFVSPGTPVRIGPDGSRVEARVSELPFVALSTAAH